MRQGRLRERLLRLNPKGASFGRPKGIPFGQNLWLALARDPSWHIPPMAGYAI